MAKVVDERALPNDKFGYRIYGVMLHLPEPQASQVRRFHELIGADDLATNPHCSVDNFWGPDSLEAVKQALEDAASKCRQVITEVDFDDLRLADWGCAYSLRSTPELSDLQQRVKEAMLPVTKRIFSEDTEFWPHTTLVLDAKPHELPLMEQMLPEIDMGGVMRFESIELIGRTGPSRGGQYEVLGSWKLKR